MADITYNELVKMPLTKLKEYALTVDGIHGVHSQKKRELIAAICEKKGIEDPSKLEAEKRKELARSEIQKVKKQRVELKQEIESKREELSKKELKEYRDRLKRLKRETRRLAGI